MDVSGVEIKYEHPSPGDVTAVLRDGTEGVGQSMDGAIRAALFKQEERIKKTPQGRLEEELAAKKAGVPKVTASDIGIATRSFEGEVIEAFSVTTSCKEGKKW